MCLGQGSEHLFDVGCEEFLSSGSSFLQDVTGSRSTTTSSHLVGSLLSCRHIVGMRANCTASSVYTVTNKYTHACTQCTPRLRYYVCVYVYVCGRITSAHALLAKSCSNNFDATNSAVALYKSTPKSPLRSIELTVCFSSSISCSLIGASTPVGRDIPS